MDATAHIAATAQTSAFRHIVISFHTEYNYIFLAKWPPDMFSRGGRVDPRLIHGLLYPYESMHPKLHLD